MMNARRLSVLGGSLVLAAGLGWAILELDAVEQRLARAAVADLPQRIAWQDVELDAAWPPALVVAGVRAGGAGLPDTLRAERVAVTPGWQNLLGRSAPPARIQARRLAMGRLQLQRVDVRPHGGGVAWRGRGAMADRDIKLEGTLSGFAEGPWTLRDLTLRWGRSALSGSLEVDTSAATTRVTGSLQSEKIMPPARGADQEAGWRIPAVALPTARMESLETDIRLRARRINERLRSPERPAADRGRGGTLGAS